LKTTQAAKDSKAIKEDGIQPYKELTIEEKLVNLRHRGKGQAGNIGSGIPISKHSKASKVSKLDYSGTDSGTAVIDSDSLLGNSMGDTGKGYYDALEIDAPARNESQSIFTMFTKLLQGKPLTSEKLAPVMNKMKEHLIAKNVAQETSSVLCKLVCDALVNKTLGPLDSIHNLVRKEMEATLVKVLMPDASINILNELSDARKKNQIYSIVFVGVNGVGKSTNLSKLCFWLLQNKVSVLIAACDTFRSGAVEQLKVHVKNLKNLLDAKIELFDAGYGKDPAAIALKSLEYAKKEGYEVVLVDTAGRMQDNLPLMRALSTLISKVNPDKIVFVGEALVGNEALSQLGKFNECISNFGGVNSTMSSKGPRKIDGILLSKFDTVDDKVGAAVSMAHITGKPIIFVGTGQTYTDLRKLNVASVVDSLLK
jgi:signal recognition particle receptor subunit alpha